jgi:flagellar hook protein FlgE
MLGTIYKGLSGLMAFSKGLDVLGNNIANLNTPGYKGTELNFRDLFYHYSTSGDGQSSYQDGQGVDASSTRTRFKQGDLRSSGNPLDIAVDGTGFLVLRQDGKTYYTRAGQLEINNQGILVDQASGMSVQALIGDTIFSDINISSLRTNPPKPTTRVEFYLNLTRTLPQTGPATHEISNISVFDSAGGEHKLQLKFTSSVSGIWTFNVLEPAVNATAVITSGEVRYDGNGSPTVGFNTTDVTLSSTGITPSTITLFFGEPGTFSGTTGYSGGTASEAKVLKQDGYAAGSLTKTTFSENGTLKLEYSNGQKADGPQLALAWFQDLQRLGQQANSLFVNTGDERPMLGHAADGIMGKVVSEKIELSNVDLTEQFTDMVIIQRGYQASSQVTTVANEMLQQLLDMRGRK